MRICKDAVLAVLMCYLTFYLARPEENHEYFRTSGNVSGTRTDYLPVRNIMSTHSVIFCLSSWLVTLHL
jgi:hypothetical protein